MSSRTRHCRSDWILLLRAMLGRLQGSGRLEPIHSAALQGSARSLGRLLEAGANVASRTKREGLTALHCAAAAAGAGAGECIQLLIAAGGDVEARDWDGCTPLMIAAEMGRKVSTAALLAGGADVQSRSMFGWTPLVHAAMSALPGPAEALLAAGADVAAQGAGGLTALHVAALRGNGEVIQALLRAGADIEARLGEPSEHFASYSYYRRMVLFELSERESEPKWVELLMAGRANPLHCAAALGHSQAVAALLQAGAGAEAASERGWRALHFASAHCQSAAMQTLLSAGASHASRDRLGLSPLDLAAAPGHLPVMWALMGAGASLGCDASKAHSPLHVAAFMGRTKVIKALLDAGADVAVEAEGGATPLHWAALGREEGAVKALVAAGAAAGACDAKGQSALYWAVRLPESCGRLAAGELLAYLAAKKRGSLSGNHRPALGRTVRLLLAVGTSAVPAPGCQQTVVDALLSERPQEGTGDAIRALAAARCPVDAGDPSTIARFFTDLLAHPGLPTWEGRCGKHSLGNADVAEAGAALLDSALAERRRPAGGKGGKASGGAGYTWAGQFYRWQPQAGSFFSLESTLGAHGSLLEQHVLEAFPEGLQESIGLYVVEGPVAVATARFLMQLQWHATLPPNPAKRWQPVHTALTIHYCRLVETLLEAGRPPAQLHIDGFWGFSLRRWPGARGFSIVVPCSPPPWAWEVISFLPLLVSGLAWSPETHPSFLPAFRRAACTLLLVNECQGFEGASPPAPAPQHARHAQRAVPGSEQDGGQRRIRLPPGVLLRILQLAARPLPAWVPALRPLLAVEA